MAQSHREASRRLFEFAEQQQGFFTTKQAKAAGFAENTHPLSCAGWELDPRALRYLPLALFAATDRPDLVLWHCGPGTATRKSRVSTGTTRRSGFTVSKLHIDGSDALGRTWLLSHSHGCKPPHCSSEVKRFPTGFRGSTFHRYGKLDRLNKDIWSMARQTSPYQLDPGCHHLRISSKDRM